MGTKAHKKNNHPEFKVGDIIFIQVNVAVFKEVGYATKSWTNHVGIVVDVSSDQPLVAESTFPVARCTPLDTFVNRSTDRQYVVARLNVKLNEKDETKLMQAALRRMGVFYGTGFDLDSKRQFCSRFVYEVIDESLGIQVGEIETFSDLLGQNPDAKLGFWRLWFLGRIPWGRKTVTPASVLNSPHLSIIYRSHDHL